MSRLRTSADQVVDSLLAHDVDTVFALPGVQTYALFDAFARAGGSLRIIGGRHEQGVAYMAFGYAQSTGRLGTYSVVPGPGVLNSSAALATAYGTSQPVLCITSEIPSAYLGRGLGHLHELPDQLATLRTLTKWSATADNADTTGRTVDEAIYRATSGRQRPVAVAIPWDILGSSTSRTTADIEVREITPVVPEQTTVRQAARMICAARNPMIMVGGGAREAPTEVRELAEFLQSPVVAFRSGKGVVSDDHPLGFNCAAGFERWADTDVLIGIGSRMELNWFRWPDAPDDLKIVLIDIDTDQVARVHPDVALIGHAAPTVRSLLRAVAEERAPAESRTDEFESIKKQKRDEFRDVGPEIEYLDVIREELPRDGYLVEDLCQVGLASYFAFEVYEPRHFITAGHQGTLGFGYPTALGVKAAHPAAPVVSISGDGGFMFGVAELATAVQYNLAVIAIVFNNNAYGNVVLDLHRSYGASHVPGTRLVNPDFAALAQTFGASGYRASTPAQLRTALRQALRASVPAVIEVKMTLGVGAGPFKYLMPLSSRT